MATNTTRRTADGSPVDFPSALKAWAQAARPVLEERARRYGAYVTYQQLAEAVQEASGIETGVPFRHWIGTVLGKLAEQQPVNEPILTSLVVHGDGTIGDGYRIPLIARDGHAPDDLEAHAAEERLRCYRHFGAEIPPGGGAPVYTKSVAAKRASRLRERVAPRAVCPTCFLQLPLAGRCDNCES